MKIRGLLFGLLLTSFVCTLYGQSKSRKVQNLEKQRSSLQQRIKKTDEELRQIKRTSKDEQKRLTLVRQQVAQRKEMITVIGREVEALQHTIDSLGVHIVGLRARERQLLEQYSHSIRAMQRRDVDADRLLFIFSSKGIDEAMLRQRFLGNYAVATSQATQKIKLTRQQIEHLQQEVNATHNQKSQLLSLREEEQKRLVQEEGKRTAQVKELKGQEQKLAQSLEAQRREAQQLDQLIQAQIMAEVKAAEEKARRAREARERRRAQQQKQRQEASKQQSATQRNTTKPQASPSVATEEAQDDAEDRQTTIRGGYAMDAQERKLSGSFAQNKGKLPMPIRGRYDLVRRFGLQQHSQHSKIQVSSGGIDLRTYADKGVYAVFAGVVSRVFITPGFGQSVILRHGNYLTVYSNLQGVKVSQGQRIAMGQSLGSVNTAGEASRAGILHFQLWHERSKLNPELWVKR